MSQRASNTALILSSLKRSKNICESETLTEKLRNSASSIHWLSSSIFTCSFVRHALYHLILSPLYDVSDNTNHIFSVRIWSWQHVSVIHCWVEPSLLLSSSLNASKFLQVSSDLKTWTALSIHAGRRHYQFTIVAFCQTEVRPNKLKPWLKPDWIVFPKGLST